MSDWSFIEDKPVPETVRVAGVELRRGDRVRLRPKPGGDIFDLALAGRVATIESILCDYEDHIHLAVVIDDDPGRDLGEQRFPGHRFFYTPEEVEPL
ncbi:MAG TPA: hypothetical protein VEK79_23125 [Thermoanaerobaculia bacterium]|nr:hypothetical protein [Thermoanaerobaculia bacterium]